MIHIYCNCSTSYPFFIPFPLYYLLVIRLNSSKMSSAQHHPMAPAFANLLDAYALWQDFEQMSAQATLNPGNVPGYDEHTHLSVPTPASAAFIMSCPYIDVPDIPEGERICCVCTDPYNYLTDYANNDELKIAQRLPCRHYVCNHCLCKWLDPFDRSNNNTCPYDRRVLFPKFSHFLNTEGMQERSDLLDWFNGARERHPMGAEGFRTGCLKAMLVERRLGAAMEELGLERSQADTLMQSRIDAREGGAAILLTYHAELLHFGRRLAAMQDVAGSVEGRLLIPTLRARLQQMSERLVRDKSSVQELWDAMNGLEEGEMA